jgi:hypothetical protein
VTGVTGELNDELWSGMLLSVGTIRALLFAVIMMSGRVFTASIQADKSLDMVGFWHGKRNGV